MIIMKLKDYHDQQLDVTDPKDQGYPDDYNTWSDFLDGEMDLDEKLEDLFNEHFREDTTGA